VLLEVIGKLKISNYLIGNQTRYLQACSILLTYGIINLITLTCLWRYRRVEIKWMPLFLCGISRPATSTLWLHCWLELWHEQAQPLRLQPFNPLDNRNQCTPISLPYIGLDFTNITSKTTDSVVGNRQHVFVHLRNWVRHNAIALSCHLVRELLTQYVYIAGVWTVEHVQNSHPSSIASPSPVIIHDQQWLMISRYRTYFWPPVDRTRIFSATKSCNKANSRAF
jgi:hypothetical protein